MYLPYLCRGQFCCHPRQFLCISSVCSQRALGTESVVEKAHGCPITALVIGELLHPWILDRPLSEPFRHVHGRVKEKKLQNLTTS